MRLVWPAQALQAKGYDVTVMATDDPERDDPDNWLRWARDFDVIVIQRAMVQEQYECVRAWKALGACVVMDLDDNFRFLDRSNVMWDLVHPGSSPRSNFLILMRTCQQLDMLTCTTQRIAQDFPHPNGVRIIPNHIPEWYLTIQPERIDDRTSIGWTGTVATHGEDLQAVGNSVARVCRRTGARFAVVGDGGLVQQKLGLSEMIKATGWLDLHTDYPVAVASFDVGVVPLKLSRFNHSKSTLKGLEMASLGVPFVSSPTEPYRGLSEHCGLSAAKPQDWERALTRLVVDEPFRTELAERGRVYAATQTIEAKCEMWWEAWEAAYRQNERRTA